MAKAWHRVKLPRITHICCGYKYDTKDVQTINYFRCFAHNSLKNFISNESGILKKVSFCITLWLVCKNNECITSFTFFYDNSGHVINKTQTSGLKYLLKLQDKFLENISLKIRSPKISSKSKKYLWRYTDSHPTKKFVSNIYNLDDKKVGETPPQPVVNYFFT